MTNIQALKSKLIDRILISKNEKMLSAINDLLASTEDSTLFEFDSHQIEMIQQGEKDIENGDFLTQDELDKSDAKWLH
jgi:predicted transcriptional regulator